MNKIKEGSKLYTKLNKQIMSRVFSYIYNNTDFNNCYVSIAHKGRMNGAIKIYFPKGKIQIAGYKYFLVNPDSPEFQSQLIEADLKLNQIKTSAIHLYNIYEEETKKHKVFDPNVINILYTRESFYNEFIIGQKNE